MPKWINDPDLHGVVEIYGFKTQCWCKRFPHRHVAFEGRYPGRRFLGCNQSSPKCCYLAWRYLPHEPWMEHALEETCKKSLKVPKALMEEEQQEWLEESKAAAKKEITPTVGAMQGICENVGHQLDPIRVTLDGMSLGV